MYQTRFFREGSGAGGGADFTLQDLTNPAKAGILPAGSKTEEEIAAEQQKTLEQEALDANGELKPGYIKNAEGKIEKDPNYQAATEPVEGADENGEPLPGYKKDADGKIVVDPDYEAPEVDDVKEFFGALDSITGYQLEVKYPDNVDPLSPEGFAIREAVIREDAALRFEQFLEQNDPRSFAYMLHRKNGGDDESFFSGQKGFVLPAKEEFDESIDQQTAVYKHDLKVKGLDDDSIDALVKKAIIDGKLKERATTAYTNIDKEDKELAESITRQNQERERLQNEAITGIVSKVDANIKAGLKFVIPETEKQAFKEFVIENMRYDSGSNTFSIVQRVEDNSLDTMMEALFFQWKKGDLSKLVAKQAKTEAAQGLRARINKNSGTAAGGRAPQSNQNNYLPLSEIKVTAKN